MRSVGLIVVACALGCATLSSGSGEADPGPTCGNGFDGTNGSAAGVVVGRITDGDGGAPIGGARVVLQGTGCAAISREDGGFRVANVPPGTYVVVVRVIGYETRSLAGVRVRPSQTTELDLALTPWSATP